MRWAVLLLMMGCDQVQVGGTPGAVDDDDPLTLTDPAEKGSLDYLHRTVVVKSCAGQPGLCHAGQFDPNLSTPALFYANLVERPGLEHAKQFRVAPGDPDNSLIIDKLRNRNVATQMPLGAKPLPEEDIALFEDWIRGGALRRPDAQPPAPFNNPPLPPVMGIWSAAGARLDGAGPAPVAVGDSIDLRHTVKDFETPDAQIAYAGFFVSTGDGSSVMLSAEQGGGGRAVYDGAGPSTADGQFDYVFHWTVPAELVLQDPYGVAKMAPASGQTLTVTVYYVDQNRNGAATLAVKPNLIQVQ
jgi:hypothetical protein